MPLCASFSFWVENEWHSHLSMTGSSLENWYSFCNFWLIANLICCLEWGLLYMEINDCKGEKENKMEPEVLLWWPEVCWVDRCFYMTVPWGCLLSSNPFPFLGFLMPSFLEHRAFSLSSFLGSLWWVPLELPLVCQFCLWVASLVCTQRFLSVLVI